MWLAWETGVLDVLLPELSSYLADASEDDSVVWRLLSEVDRTAHRRGSPLEDTVLWTALLLEPLREACSGAQDRMAAAHEFLEPIVERLSVPRRIADAMRRIVAALPRLESGRASRFTRTTLYSTALEVMTLLAAAREEASSLAVLPAPRAGDAVRASAPSPPQAQAPSRRRADARLVRVQLDSGSLRPMKT